LVREESTTESVNSLHGTAAVGADAVAGPIVSLHSYYVKPASIVLLLQQFMEANEQSGVPAGRIV
jgi:hypothetical protein